MTNFESTSKEEKRFQIDYPAMIYQRSHSLHHHIKNLKFFLENPDSNSNNKLQEEMESERNEKVQYNILDDLQTLCHDINYTNFLPNYTVKLLVTPKYRTDEDLAYWR